MRRKKWRWIFDSKGFGLKHALEVRIGIGIAKLITKKYSHNLESIVIKNPNWYIKSMYIAVAPFLTKEVNDIIIFE